MPDRRGCRKHCVGYHIIICLINELGPCQKERGNPPWVGKMALEAAFAKTERIVLLSFREGLVLAYRHCIPANDKARAAFAARAS